MAYEERKEKQSQQPIVHGEKQPIRAKHYMAIQTQNQQLYEAAASNKAPSIWGK
jgi:hypothetical protein